MADMGTDELLDGPAKAPGRPTRFAPKGSKFNPKPKTEPSQSLPPSASGSVEPLSLPKKEELSIKPDIKTDYGDDAFDIDVGVKPELKEEKKDDLMETEETEADFVDEVVREIDVYFTPSLDSKTRLYVLQHPLRPLWRPYELDERCQEVRVKPESSEVEIDLTVNVDPKHYNPDADPRVQMEKQSLVTAWKPPQVSGYAVGVLTGNKLHLNPVHAIVQLRSSLQHLVSKESKMQTGNIENKVKSEELQEGKPSSLKKLSKMPEQTKDNEEGWIPLEYHSSSSDVAVRYLQKMMALEGSQIDFSMSAYDYVNSLCPGTSSDNSGPKVPPIRFLLTLPLKERFRTWLLEGPPVHRFNTLKYLAPDEPVEEILGVLQEHARLVQGLWVPRSSLVYGTDSGINVVARDYVLLLFTKKLTIQSKDLPRMPQLANAMKEVLNSLAVERRVFDDWKLKELPDLSFEKSNPSVVRKQEEEWNRLEEKVTSFLSAKKVGHNMKSSIINHSRTTSSSKAAAVNPKGVTTGAGMSEEVRAATTRAVQKLFKTVKICSFQQISQLLRDMAVSESARSTGFAREAVAAASSIDAYPDELHAIINHVAVNIHGVCVPKSSPDNPQYDPFRKVVIDLLIAQGPNAKLRKASILEAAKLELQREIPPNEFQKVVPELCTSQGSAWSLKSPIGNPKH